MRKINKILIILSVIILLTFMFCTTVSALDPNNFKPDDPTPGEATIATKKVGVILGVVRNISAVVAVIAIMVIGLKYMFGSVEEKANYKSTMMPYIIGCAMAVVGTTIVSFIYAAIH